ncbi:MAG: DnaA/Hda family protein [Hyphococcus sp.]
MNKTASVTQDEENSQLAFSLPASKPSYDRESYIVSDSNIAAWRCVEAWAESPEPALVICGPSGAGKTHLSRIAAEIAENTTSSHIQHTEDNETNCVIFDDMPPVHPERFLERIEALIEEGVRLVLVGDGHPSEWAKGLKDLRTRLEAMPRASLGEPDEALLRQLIAKSFRERQLVVGERLIDYIAPRLPRTFDAARAFVAQADAVSLKTKKKIAMPLAQKILADLFDDAPVR